MVFPQPIGIWGGIHHRLPTTHGRTPALSLLIPGTMNQITQKIRAASTTILFLLMISAVHARDPWITQTGLTLSQLNSQAEPFLDPKVGMMPLQISGYDDHGTARYSVLWEIY